MSEYRTITPRTIVGHRGVGMKAIGHGNVADDMVVDGESSTILLQDVLYVPGVVSAEFILTQVDGVHASRPCLCSGSCEQVRGGAFSRSSKEEDSAVCAWHIGPRLHLGSSETPPRLHGYCNADWVSSPDDRVSISGYVFYLGDGDISRNRKKQPSVAVSTTEAEYMSMSHACREVIWLRRLAAAMRVTMEEGGTLLKGDNKNAIQLAKNQTVRNPEKEPINITKSHMNK